MKKSSTFNDHGYTDTEARTGKPKHGTLLEPNLIMVLREQKDRWEAQPKVEEPLQANGVSYQAY